MKLSIVIINILFLLIGFNCYTQEIVIPKDTIYLEYKPNDGSLPHYRGKKFINEHGLNFNLYEGEGLIFPEKGDSDTLNIKNLEEYYLTSVSDLDSLGRLWYKKNLPNLKKKYGKIIAPHDKNGKFVTYLLEEFNDCFIKYRVYWRNENAID